MKARQVFSMDLLQGCFQGAMIGLAVSVAFLLASGGFTFTLLQFFGHVVLGILAGLSITIATIAVGSWVDTLESRVGKAWIFLKIGTVYITGTLCFYFSGSLLSLLPGIFPEEGNFILYNSTSIGFITVLVSMVYGYLEEKEAALKMEKEYRELAVLEERNRIARDLHDSVSQNLFGLSLNLNAVKHMIPNDPGKALAVIASMATMVQEVQAEMRLMIYELQPISLKNKRLFGAVEDMVRVYSMRFGINVVLKPQGDDAALDIDRQTVLYRVLQESLNNCVRHSRATEIEVNLEINENWASMQVSDNGIGFAVPTGPIPGSMGIVGMQERVQGMGGRFQIISESEKGTLVSIQIPN